MEKALIALSSAVSNVSVGGSCGACKGIVKGRCSEVLFGCRYPVPYVIIMPINDLEGRLLIECKVPGVLMCKAGEFPGPRPYGHVCAGVGIIGSVLAIIKRFVPAHYPGIVIDHYAVAQDIVDLVVRFLEIGVIFISAPKDPGPVPLQVVVFVRVVCYVVDEVADEVDVVVPLIYNDPRG